MAFIFKKNQLYLEQGKKSLCLKEFLRKQKSPLYLYDLDGILEQTSFLKKSLKRVRLFYALKANDHSFLLKKLSSLVGADVVSLGEMKKALKSGFKAKNIVFSGVAKTEKEITYALKKKILRINVESLPELKRIKKLAQKLKTKAQISLRVNPDIPAHTHPYITTGLKDNKFGIDETDLKSCLKILKKEKFLSLKGLSFHIGSQITDFKAFSKSFKKMRELFNLLKKDFLELEDLNLGGGLGIDYSNISNQKNKEFIRAYAKEVRNCFKSFKSHLFMEPGRILLAPFGLLLTQVEYVKKTKRKNFLIVNSGMNHFMRPCLYQASHLIEAIFQKNKKIKCDIVGPICESADFFGKNRKISEVEEKDWICVFHVGAYGRVMQNEYNSHDKIKELFIYKGKAYL